MTGWKWARCRGRLSAPLVSRMKNGGFPLFLILSCGFWKSQPTPYQDDLWLLLAWAGFDSREKALETNAIYTLRNSGLVVPSPACIPLPLLRMSLTCGCRALLFACRMYKTFPVGLDTTTPGAQLRGAVMVGRVG